jgi:hypothetical protein
MFYLQSGQELTPTSAGTLQLYPLLFIMVNYLICFSYKSHTMKITETLKKFSSYLWGKKKELADMDEKDVLLAKVVMDIHRKRSHTTFQNVPLFELFPIHPIDREGSLASMEKRSSILRAHRTELLEKKVLSGDILKKYIPSITAIKGVRTGDASYVTFEGNGRLAAMQNVFTAVDNMKVEIELYHFSNMKKIIRRVERVRSLHNL